LFFRFVKVLIFSSESRGVTAGIGGYRISFVPFSSLGAECKGGGLGSSAGIEAGVWYSVALTVKLVIGRTLWPSLSTI
jgi:hypothetical protein